MPIQNLIDFELKRLVERELMPDEELLWMDQPVARFFSPLTLAMLISGIFWTACVLMALAHSYNFTMPVSIKGSDVFTALVFMFFLLFGSYFLFAPLRQHHYMRKTVYAITDRRAISIRNRRKPLIRTYSFDEISQIRIDEKRSGLGDVIIVCGARVVGEILYDQKDGFYHIKNVREVARELEEKVTVAQVSKKADVGKQADAKTNEEIEKPPLLVENTVPDRDLKADLKAFLGMPLFLAGIGLIVLLAFGMPAAIAWATNTGVPGFLFFLLLSFLLPQVRHMFTAKESTDWPTVQGVIKESYVLTDSDGGYNPRVKYKYQINGKEYSNKEITTKQRSDTLNRNPAEAIIARYPEGHPVTVYYNPRKPGYAVLEPGRGFGNWMALAILLPCCLASYIWMAATWEGFDSDRFTSAWRDAKRYVGLEPADEEKKLPISVQLPKEQDPVFRNRKYRVTSKHLWINLDPFGKNSVIGDLKKGAIVKVYTEKDSWALVKTSSGKEGWVLRQSVEEVKTRPPPDIKATPAPERPPAAIHNGSHTNQSSEVKVNQAFSKADIDRFFIALVEDKVDVVQRYLKKGMSPNVKWVRGDTALVSAVAGRHDNIAIMLIEAGADVSVRDPAAIPLVWASGRCDSVKLVKALIAAGADVNARAEGGSTPLVMAQAFNCPEIGQVLLDAGAR